MTLLHTLLLFYNLLFSFNVKFIFLQDELLSICNDGPVRSFSYTRLKLLEIKFKTHVQLNRDAEREESAIIAHRDFYNVRKVDTHIHHSACMNAKHLLRFIKHKLRFSPDEICKRIFTSGERSEWRRRIDIVSISLISSSNLLHCLCHVSPLSITPKQVHFLT